MANVAMFRDHTDGTIAMASSASTSASIDLRNRAIAGIYFPTVTSAVYSFQARRVYGSGTYVDVWKTDGSAKYVTATITGALALSVHDILCGFSEVRVVASVVQTAARTIGYTLKG